MVAKKEPAKPIKNMGLGSAPEKPVVKTTAGSAKARKTAARMAAVQVLYQMRLNNQDAKSTVREFMEHRIGFSLDGDVLVPADPELLEKIVIDVAHRLSDIEIITSKALADDKKGDVETLLQSILHAGIGELLTNGEIDTGIIINDYLNITAGFYNGNETKIVNAILDKVAKSVRD
ncbi:MAG: transcription antitermination protein NusB [Alphaproteobacteria bacterium]|nr:transcription antitermination protein NusB [Alphaproteobacteria bacterium]